MSYMASIDFSKLKKRDFDNGAIRDDIWSALRQRETLLTLCTELDRELDGVRIPKSAAEIVNAIRSLLKECDQ